MAFHNRRMALGLKICPIVTRDAGWDVLVFRHPHAGVQVVKGTMRPHETVFTAAARELYEESGLRARHMERVGEREIAGLRWIFVLCHVAPTPEVWDWDTLDDHGHRFAFFWHDQFDPAPPDCAPDVVQALGVIAALTRHGNAQ